MDPRFPAILAGVLSFMLVFPALAESDMNEGLKRFFVIYIGSIFGAGIIGLIVYLLISS